jgi:hypothetical protein
MADIRQVEIKIVGDKKKETVSQKVSDPTQGAKDDEDEEDEDSADTSTAKLFTSAYLVSKAKDVTRDVLQETDYFIQRHFQLADDYQGQRSYTVAKNVVLKSVSIGTSAIAAASTLGPVGAVIAVGAAVASTAVDVANNYINQADTIRKMDAQLSYTRVRAGYSLTAGSVGEDK